MDAINGQRCFCSGKKACAAVATCIGIPRLNGADGGVTISVSRSRREIGHWPASQVASLQHRAAKQQGCVSNDDAWFLKITLGSHQPTFPLSLGARPQHARSVWAWTRPSDEPLSPGMRGRVTGGAVQTLPRGDRTIRCDFKEAMDLIRRFHGTTPIGRHVITSAAKQSPASNTKRPNCRPSAAPPPRCHCEERSDEAISA